MTEPPWKQRFRAPNLTLPGWAIDDPDRLVYASNLSGSWQVHAWDRAGGSHRRVTDHPTGVIACAPTPDGAGVAWFEDSKGDEIGRWLLQPFHGGEVTPVLGDVEPAWSAGLALGPAGRVALGLATRDGFAVRVGELGGASRELYRHDQNVDVADLSRDGRLLVVHHAEHGDNLHPALRAFDLRAMAPLADLWDGEGYGLFAAGFSPVAGDPRLALLHERSGRLRPAVWDPLAGERVDLDVDLPGEVDVADWWPDGSALLLRHTHLGRDELYRLDLTGGLRRLDHEPGSITSARVRPDGEVWYRRSSGATAPEVRAVGGTRVGLPPPRPGAPAGRDDLIARGLADADQVVITGASWGGYVTLQAIGTVPDGWRAAMAVVPVADYLSAYADEAEALQAFDRSLFGGGPEEQHVLYVDRSPITHAASVKTPVLLMVGDNDTRCPLQQVLNYAGRLTELGKEHELDRFDAGHGALVVDERIRQTEVLLRFAARHVPGAAAPVG